jgi:acetyltransferase EpsM
MESIRLLILGTGTFAVELADFAGELDGVEIAGFVENMDRDKCGGRLDDRPIYWVDEIASMRNTHSAVCGISSTHRSRFTEQAARLGVGFATIVHPTSRVSSKSTLGEGTVISPGVHIASHTKIGRHTIVNRGALIGHHNEFGEFITIQPGANIAGCCAVGDATYIGMGAVIIDRIRIGSHSVIAAGAVVTRDVPDNVLVMGVPARIVKEGIEGK